MSSLTKYLGRIGAAWCLVGVFAFHGSRPARADQNQPPLPAGDAVQLRFSENVEIRVLLNFVSHELGLNIIYDEQIANKRVTIRSPKEIPRASLLGLLHSVLNMKGLALVDTEQPGMLQVVAAGNLAAHGQPLLDQHALEGASPFTAMTQVFMLKHLEPRQAEQLVKTQLTRPGGNSVILPQQSVLVVSDYAGNLQRIAALLRTLDQPEAQVSLEVLPARHVDAAVLAQQLTQMFALKARASGGAAPQADATRLEIMHDPRINQIVLAGTDKNRAEARELLETIDVPVNLSTEAHHFEHVSAARIDRLARAWIAGSGAERLYRAAIDAEGNMLLVTATAETHEQIRQLKHDLDVLQPRLDRPMRIYKLVNTRATDILQTIQAIESDTTDPREAAPPLSTTAAAALRPQRAAVAPMDAAQPHPPLVQSQSSGPDSMEALISVRLHDASVVADINTNSLIIVAPLPVQAAYEQLIKALDKRRPQVLVEATIVTVDTSDGFSIGVEMSTRASRGRYLNFSSFGLSEVSAEGGELTLTPGFGFNGILVPSEELQVVIRALKTSGRAKVLSSPRVLVNDHATGVLSSVNEAPFVSVNASDTVATTSFAGFVSAGTTITITPHISEDDHLNLEYAISLNSFTGDAAEGIPPPRQTNTIQSEVTVPSGASIILGGLNRKDQSDTRNRVPFLGDLPLFGHLFGTTDHNNSETTLFVFLRPVILRQDAFEDLKYLSRADMNDAGLDPAEPRSEPMIMR